MSKEFEATNIHQASLYLDEKLQQFKQDDGEKKPLENVYVVEDKKDSFLTRIVSSLFK